MYYYYSYTFRQKQTGDIIYADGVFHGNIVELIEDLKKYSKTDTYCDSYILTFYKEIEQDEYKKLKDIVG